LPFPFPRSRVRFRIALTAVILVVAGGIVGLATLGRFMAAEDPLQHADAIFVFAGTRVERPMEAYDLYHAGYAPRVVVTRAVEEQATTLALQKGVHIVTDVEVNIDLLRALGVPQAALIVPDRVHDNTAMEAQTLRDLAVRYHWHRVILVTSKYHLRRALVAATRELRGTGVELIRRGSRYDPSTPDRWWRRRSDIRWLLSEVPKLVAYELGLGA
jgi:uncharacterized SAM-binding protein YcdF (DUF218 family)